MREKGSKTAMQKLVKSSDYLTIINGLFENNELRISADDDSIPNQQNPNKEVTLSTFLRQNFDSQKATDITKWWIKYGNATPKWDLIYKCTIDGKEGILLVEAKAHKGELKKDKKSKPKPGNSETNHEQIGEVIDTVNEIIKNKIKSNDIKLSRDNCYQFSNRVAHAWWLANQGIPVVLLYLGFLNVTDMEDKYKTFTSHDDWKNCFEAHTKLVGADGLIDKTIICGEGSFVTICKTM